MRLRFGYTTNWEDGRKRVELRMEGASQREWWDTVVLPSLLGGCADTGGKRKGTNEPVRFLNDALKPKLYVYDRYNDMYLLYLRRVKPINRISTVTNCELVYVRFNWFLQNDIFLSLIHI